MNKSSFVYVIYIRATLEKVWDALLKPECWNNISKRGNYCKPMPVIFHITTEPEWTAAKAAGLYEAPSLKDEGFAPLLPGRSDFGCAWNRYFSEKQQLLKPEHRVLQELKSQLIYE